MNVTPSPDVNRLSLFCDVAMKADIRNVRSALTTGTVACAGVLTAVGGVR